MNNKPRPLGMTIFILWSGIMGFFIAWDGWGYFMKGVDVSTAPEFWVQDLRHYIFPGALWVLGGLGFCASAIGLWSAKNWARVAGLYSGAALVAGWILIKIISLGFGNPASLLSLFVGIPAFYLLTDEAKAYCTE
jgi:hypothetical protein